MTDEMLKKKRKTIDEYLGITGLAIIAVVGSLFGGLIRPMAYVAGLSAGYYLIKRRNDPTLKKNTKIINWILLVIWLVEVGFISSMGI